MKIFAQSPKAEEVLEAVEYLQNYFAQKLNETSALYGTGTPFERVEWARDGGAHGGGDRLEARDETLFNRASINVSQVHYDDKPQKQLSSATAISTIIHPKNPHLPSIHMHISFTELRNKKMYWRLMADLNPSILNEEDATVFDAALKESLAELYEDAKEQGEKYFYIPALKRTRGVSHFYLEGYNSGDFNADKNFALSFGKEVIDTYVKIIQKNLQKSPTCNDADKKLQREYHTLYLFQVLTLDRGTTSGLLVHDQNDVGIMGSIPSHVDTNLLRSWIELMPKPQDKLLENIVGVLGDDAIVEVNEEVKAALAKVVRAHYKKYPEALDMQASGSIVPPTVSNHT